MLSEKSIIPELDNKKNTAIFIIGAPGSGKSSFVANKLSLGRYSNNTSRDVEYITTPTQSHYKVFNSDVTSKRKTGDDNIRYAGSTRLSFLYLTGYIASNSNFIYESTGSNINLINEILTLCTNYKKILIFLDTDQEIAYQNTLNRTRKVDEPYFNNVYNNMNNIFNTLSHNDKFDAIYKVNNNNNNYTFYKMINGKLTRRYTGNYV